MPTISETNWTGLLVGTDGEDYRLLSSGAYLSGPFNHHVPDADSLLYWRMDEASWNGTAGEVIDRSGKGNHGRAVDGVQPLPALMGNGADAGTSYGWPYLRGPNLTGWQAANRLTVSFWVCVRSWTSQVQDGSIVCQAAYQTEWRNPYRSWGIICNWNGQILWLMASGSTGWKSGLVPLNEWTHVALTWDGSTITGYVNGVSRGTGAAPWAWTDQIGPINVLNELGGLRSSPAGKNWIVDELVISKAVRTIDPGLYASKFARCTALDAGGRASWSGVSVASPTPTSTERWGLYLQATDSPIVPAQTDPAWQQAAIGQAGNATLDLSALGLQGRYLHRMWFLNPSLDAKKWHQASIGACEWSYAPVVSGRRSTQWRRYGPILIPTGVM